MEKEEIIARLNASRTNTLMETLEMEYVDLDYEAGWVSMKMPVNSRVHQPMGILHGGATAALAESVGSASSILYIDRAKQNVVGIELSCNHLRSLSEGEITAVAQSIHRGRKTHLWEIRISDQDGRLISHCKLTNMVLDKTP